MPDEGSNAVDILTLVFAGIGALAAIAVVAAQVRDYFARRQADVRPRLEFNSASQMAGNYCLVIENHGPADARDVKATMTKVNLKGARIDARLYEAGFPVDLDRDQHQAFLIEDLLSNEERPKAIVSWRDRKERTREFNLTSPARSR